MKLTPFSFQKPAGRPFLFTSFVSSIDGKIIVKEKGYWPIGSGTDKDYFTWLRAHASAVVDARTTAYRFAKYFIRRIHEDMYQGFRKDLGMPPLPEYIILTSHPDEYLAEKLKNDYGFRPTILTTADAQIHKTITEVADVQRCHAELDSASSEVRLDSGSGSGMTKKRVEIKDLIDYLNKQGHKIVFVDGGPTLIAQLLQEQVLDEIHLTIAPKVFGSLPGKTLTMVEGILFPPDKVPKFKLISVEKLEDEVVLRYSK